MSVPAISHGETVNITVTQLFAIKGRLGQQITFTSIGSPFSIATEQRIAAAACSGSESDRDLRARPGAARRARRERGQAIG